MRITPAAFLIGVISFLFQVSAAIIEPTDGAQLDSPLAVKLRWTYPVDSALHPASNIHLIVSSHEDGSAPIVDVTLPENVTTYRLAVVPQTTYFWQAIPMDGANARKDSITHGKFTSGKPRIDDTTDDRIRYRNMREGAHWTNEKPVEFDQPEPLAPWFDRKAYTDHGMPTFDEVKDRFPDPIYDGHPDAINAYWYCWRTVMGVWYYAPDAPDHQAVANLCGYRNWGVWGSTMVWDTCFILHFARYGGDAYPFITAMDNCYARQHENGYICRESDRNNREVSSSFPVNPPLFAWAEWEWFQISGDRDRLRRVFLPIVKQYEWFMTYQRRSNGLYWTDGINEADDSPRNALMKFSVSATSYQALAAQCLSQMAHEIGRDDMAPFFQEQHDQLGKIVNEHFWDEKHQIYNDLDGNGQFITELKPGVFCKHVHMFWPLIAGIAPPERVQKMVDELKNPASFNRRNGVPSLSADSAGYTGGPNGTGQYWCGAVWPSGQCMVQEGLKASGQDGYAAELSQKYFNAQLEVFDAQKTNQENLAPDRPAGYAPPNSSAGAESRRSPTSLKMFWESRSMRPPTRSPGTSPKPNATACDAHRWEKPMSICSAKRASRIPIRVRSLSRPMWRLI